MPQPHPRVVVVMATYEPDPALLHRQVSSITKQTFTDFVCVVHDDGSSAPAAAEVARLAADDPRFVVAQHDDNVGFYRNFERGLLHAREYSPEFIALSDQDDVWYPDKLATAVAALEHSPAALAFADVSIVDPTGRQLRPSFFEHRHPTTSTVLDLTMMNSVIGATSVFRTHLLSVALPFPTQRPRSFHDHWLARCAQVTGGLTFIPRAAMDYVQHGGNVQGDTKARHQLLDFVRAARSQPVDGWPVEAELVRHRLAELRVLQSRLPKAAAGNRELRHAIAVHEHCVNGSVAAFAAMAVRWFRDQYLRRRPRHEHIELWYARTALHSRMVRRKGRNGA